MRPRCTDAPWLALVAAALALAACTAAAAAGSGNAARPAHAAAQGTDTEPPLVCVVIRTYYAHGTYGDSSLINLLRSLQRQTHTRWHALVLVMDNRPFPDLRHIVRGAADERIQVFAEWISASYQPRTSDGKQWSLGYHTRLYNLTDEAVRACPRATRWLLVTNGDNEYDQDMMATLASHGDAEVVAFDYYSRFQRPTGIPCERFAAGPGIPPCKTNNLSWCQTDLAANAYAWPRFIRDDMRFGVLDSGHGANHDGFMADVVRQRRWLAVHVQGRCLVDHAPSPQSCAVLDGVWDDTAAGSDAGAGGRCLHAATADRLVAQLGDAVEEVTIDVSHDKGFGMPAGPLKLRCVRAVDRARWRDLAAYFPAACVSYLDAPALEGDQPNAGVSAA